MCLLNKSLNSRHRRMELMHNVIDTRSWEVGSVLLWTVSLANALSRDRDMSARMHFSWRCRLLQCSLVEHLSALMHWVKPCTF